MKLAGVLCGAVLQFNPPAQAFQYPLATGKPNMGTQRILGQVFPLGKPSELTLEKGVAELAGVAQTQTPVPILALLADHDEAGFAIPQRVIQHHA
jgi:hypothetical protein